MQKKALSRSARSLLVRGRGRAPAARDATKTWRPRAYAARTAQPRGSGPLTSVSAEVGSTPGGCARVTAPAGRCRRVHRTLVGGSACPRSGLSALGKGSNSEWHSGTACLGAAKRRGGEEPVATVPLPTGKTCGQRRHAGPRHPRATRPQACATKLATCFPTPYVSAVGEDTRPSRVASTAAISPDCLPEASQLPWPLPRPAQPPGQRPPETFRLGVLGQFRCHA